MYVKKHTATMHTVQIDGWSRLYYLPRSSAIRQAQIDYITYGDNYYVTFRNSALLGI